MSQPTRLLLAMTAFVDALSEWTGRAAAWLTLGMVVLTFAVVVLRYFFNIGWVAMQEGVMSMFALVFLLGAAYTLKHDGHVRVDIVYRKLGPRGQAWVDLLGSLLLLLPVMLLILVLSWDYVAASWSLHEGSRESGGLPGVYLIKSAILVAAALLILQGLAQALRSLLVLLGKARPAAEQHRPEV